jgi:hypothetical protein
VAESSSEFGLVDEPDFLTGREWLEPGHDAAGDDTLTLCKAAWLLTLQCFVQSDILCFAYEEATAAAGPVLYFTRVDRDDEVWSFLRSLATSTPSAVVTEPRGHEIRAVEGLSAAGDFGNTMLCYHGESNRVGAKLALPDARKPPGVGPLINRREPFRVLTGYVF